MSSLLRKLGNLLPPAARAPAKHLVIRLGTLRNRAAAIAPLVARTRANLADRRAEIELRLHSAIERAAYLWKLRVLSFRKTDIVLFLAPEAGLGPYMAAHAMLAKSLQEAGHAAMFLACDGIQPICSLKFAMSTGSTASGDQTNPACQLCRAAARRIYKDYDLLGVPMESLAGAKEQRLIAGHLAGSDEDVSGLTIEGIAFGALAVADATRDRRDLDAASLRPEDRVLINAVLHSSLAIYFAINKLASTYTIKRIAFIGDYGCWISAQILAKQLGIAVTRVSHLYNRDVDQRVIGLQPNSANTHLLDQLDDWDKYRSIPIEPRIVSDIADGALYRLSGNGGVSTYSPNWVRRDGGLHAELGLSPLRKTIVAYNSSADEILASRAILKAMGRPYEDGTSPFSDQRAWMLGLMQWVGTRPDLQLIIRMHPRIAAGTRDSSVSAEYHQLKEDFRAPPANVAIVWPEDKVSSYNLAEIADAAVVAWSTMGLELARFGVPVVAAFARIGSFPVGSFIGFEETAGRYFQVLESAINQSASLDSITEAFRWTYCAFWAPGVDFSDLVPTPNFGEVPPWRTPKNGEFVKRVLVDGEDMSAINMARLPTGDKALASERAAMLSVLDRFMTFLMCGEDRPGAHLQNLNPLNDRFVSADIDGVTYRRYSPLLHRLASLSVESNAAARIEVASRRMGFQQDGLLQQ
jgi:hypothetical protein